MSFLIHMKAFNIEGRKKMSKKKQGENRMIIILFTENFHKIGAEEKRKEIKLFISKKKRNKMKINQSTSKLLYSYTIYGLEEIK